MPRIAALTHFWHELILSEMERSRPFILFKLAAIACLATSSVLARTPAGAGMTIAAPTVWGRLSSHFRLATVGQPLSDRLQHEALEALEKWHRRFLILFETEPEPPIAVLFYPAHLFHRQTGAPPWADGVYEQDGLIRIAAGGVARLEPDIERVLAHELAHAFITVRSAGHAPRWLQEGLAQFLAGASSNPAFHTRATAPDSLGYQGSLVFTQALERRFGITSLIDILAELRAGSSMSGAFETVTGVGSEALFVAWRGAGTGREVPAP